MITVEEAKKILFPSIEKLNPVSEEILEAFGCVLSEDIHSPIDLPSFNQSAMDGYALAPSEINKKQFDVVGEVKAGDAVSVQLKSGQAVRIFTGAEVPSSADAIVIQEKVEQSNGTILLSAEVRKGESIRFKGSQIKKGELALAKGTVLNPATIGFLASLGINKVSVAKKPVVSIIATGNELMMSGDQLLNGQIYESNTFSLQAALQQMHINPWQIHFVKDDLKILTHQIENSLRETDILIITGGISVGKYDFVHEALNALGVETLFYKVAQKPGKPFFFGKSKNKLIFALPGNPAAVLVCFYEYIYPAIRMMQGFAKPMLPVAMMPLQKTILNKEDRALFIRAKKMNNGIEPLEQQGSDMLRSFAEADGLIYVPKEKKEIIQGEEVEVHLLPFNF